jgi:hypothetical protein
MHVCGPSSAVASVEPGPFGPFLFEAVVEDSATIGGGLFAAVTDDSGVICVRDL